jgi:3-oxoacyl-[acyl-carrier-protein] synthase-3
LFDTESLTAFINGTGVERKRKAPADTCTSDLCIAAAEQLIKDLQWNKEDIDILIFVSQTPDYVLPATACVIQERLGLSTDCYAMDISLGCSGWVYGLQVVSSLLQSLDKKGKALLLVGDTILKFCSETDKSTYPLFGDAGTATALEYNENTGEMYFDMHTDGSGYKAIIIEDGGFRKQVTESSFAMHNRGEGISSNNLQLSLDGMDVFSFGIQRAPQSVNALIEHFQLDKEGMDYFLFHQANLFMNEKIRKKLQIPPEKVPYSLKDFGNTSSATIPLTMVTQLQKDLQSRHLKNIACGFGVGLSWGSVYFETDCITVPDLIEI